MSLQHIIAIVAVAGISIADGVDRARAQDAAPDQHLVARGSYLAKAADCMPCHTSAPDKPYAGGLKMNTPFGAMYSPNITPDRDTGIGKWTFDDFKKAVHSGIRADGKFLYPAMPFDAFVGITDDDLKALWAYFRSLPATKQQNRENELSFPFNIRFGMLVWRWMFFNERGFQPDQKRDAQWNRGAYLAEALGHCGDCHTPRNIMGATIASMRFEGATIDQWYAPDITAETLSKVNKWDKAELIAFLKDGASKNSTALGPMQEVVHDSLAALTPGDLDAMATYLLDLPSVELAPKPAPVAKLAPEVEKHAEQLYAANCASCHQTNGQGVANAIPPLAGNPAVIAAKPFNILATVLQGIPARDNIIAMPGFAGSLSEVDIANLVNYVRTSWGNQAAPNATPEVVATWRSSLSLPLYGSDSARKFDCPTVGQGADPNIDPNLVATLSDEMAQSSVSYATLVQSYKAQQPDADMATIVNNLVAAYCPIVAKAAMSDQAKSMKVKRFALNISAYLSDQSVAETEPDAGIIWAVPAGYSLAERDPSWQPRLACPPNDNSRVPQSLVGSAAQVVGKANLDFLAADAIAQARSMATQNSTAKPADVANALILAYCEGVMGVSGPTDAEKLAGIMRYGEEVIQALQHTAETQKPPPSAKTP